MSGGIERAVAVLRDCAGAFPEQDAPAFDLPATAGQIEALRKASRGFLGGQFEEFLRVTAGIVAMNVRNGYWIGGPNELTRALKRGDLPLYLSASNRGTPVVTVATDGGGNAFLVDVDTGAVWFWDHETSAERLVAADFVAFLRRVAEDWRHAAAGDETWDYIS